MWAVSLARLLGSASWARPGSISQWAVLGRLLRGARGLRFCSLRLYVEAAVKGGTEILTARSKLGQPSLSLLADPPLAPLPAETTG